ncbi:hypothetical protein HMF8227_02791 [Saliniradius amylolyticus]|uniref:Uncharacterized protein n=1 Tax=Saliniradius amylolyticus TaxID=2183582 RepID=A0A2S2E7P9_9ALTE|nr:hypothetical protein [Saliniradius amylolyticus]AWL13240.1 hypothetical protein HMF8227_02791 [Saliniradius amylolyticus]
MKLTIWCNQVLVSLAMMSQGDLTHRRDKHGVARFSSQGSSPATRSPLGTDLGCDAELRAATLEGVLTRLA